MPIRLHVEARKTILEALTKAVPNIIVNNKMFLDRKSLVWLFLANMSLPKHGKLHETLVARVGEYPLFDFVEGWLSRELYTRDEYDSDLPSLPLSQIAGYEDPRRVAEVWVREFETLPWPYVLSLKLPSEVSAVLRDVVNRVPFGDRAFLVCPDDDFIEQHPLLSGNSLIDKRIHSRGGALSLLFSNLDPRWDEAAVYFQIFVEGFVGPYGGGPAAFSVESTIKSFCGLCLALRALKISRTYTASPPKEYVYVHRRGRTRWIIDGRIELDQTTESVFRDLAVHDLDGFLDTDDKKKRWCRSVLSDIQCVFADVKKSEKIILAAQWLFESYSGRNELLSFVQAMVTLEILLGEQSSSEIGLGELLRNRCAFLISENHQQRIELLDEFNEIYRVRSQIVHRGKSQLTSHERALFRKLQWMCHRAIQEEVRLLKADQQNQAEQEKRGRVLAAP
jgi:hypothetical protein